MGERHELEDLWRSRLADAKVRLDFARLYTQEVQRDLPELPRADANFALRRAMRAENAALAHYQRVLCTLTDLVLDGKIPNEDEWGKTADAGENENPD